MSERARENLLRVYVDRLSKKGWIPDESVVGEGALEGLLEVDQPIQPTKFVFITVDGKTLGADTNERAQLAYENMGDGNIIGKTTMHKSASGADYVELEMRQSTGVVVSLGSVFLGSVAPNIPPVGNLEDLRAALRRGDL